jgi:hypothetical protein
MALPLSTCNPGKQILQLELWSENSLLNDEFIGAVEIDLHKMYGKQTGSACRQEQCLQLDTGGSITCLLTFGDTIDHFKSDKDSGPSEAERVAQIHLARRESNLTRRESMPTKDQHHIIVQVHRGKICIQRRCQFSPMYFAGIELKDLQFFQKQVMSLLLRILQLTSECRQDPYVVASILPGVTSTRRTLAATAGEIMMSFNSDAARSFSKYTVQEGLSLHGTNSTATHLSLS